MQRDRLFIKTITIQKWYPAHRYAVHLAGADNLEKNRTSGIRSFSHSGHTGQSLLL